MTKPSDRSRSEIEALRDGGGVFVNAVRLTRMPMLVTDARLPGCPLVFANDAFCELTGYSADELLGQFPHFMNGPDTDGEAIRRHEEAMDENSHATLELLQYRKDGTSFLAMLFIAPLRDDHGAVIHHFKSYLDISRRYHAEQSLRTLTAELEERVAARTRELVAANDRLTTLLAERDMLLVEVNHRAKNSLAIASSLIRLQSQRHLENSKAIFDQTQERLNALSRMHDLLSKSGSVQQVDIADYLDGLCDVLRPLLDGDDRVRLQVQAEEGVMVHADIAIPLGIVIGELITNAIKYAFPAPRMGTILAQAHRARAGWGRTIIRDDGIGVTQLREGSLGFGIVRALVKQIGGDISFRNDPGLVATIVFPLRKL